MDINYSYFNTAKGYKVVGGTAAQFLKADGSVDNNTYTLSTDLNNYVLKSGDNMTGNLAVNYAGGSGTANINLKTTNPANNTTYFIRSSTTANNIEYFSVTHSGRISGSALSIKQNSANGLGLYGGIETVSTDNNKLFLGAVADSVGSYIGQSRYISSNQYQSPKTYASLIQFDVAGKTIFYGDNGLTVDTNYTPTINAIIDTSGITSRNNVTAVGSFNSASGELMVQRTGVNRIRTGTTSLILSGDTATGNIYLRPQGDVATGGQVIFNGNNTSQYADSHNILLGTQTSVGSALFNTNVSSVISGYGLWMGQNLQWDGTNLIQPRGSLGSYGFTVNNHKGFSFNYAASSGVNGSAITLTEVASLNGIGTFATNTVDAKTLQLSYTAKSIVRLGGANNERVHHKVYNDSIISSQTGILSFSITPPSASATMFDITIKIHTYGGAVSAEIRLTFYRQVATGINATAGMSGSIWASDGFGTEVVNVGFDPSGKMVINIGDPTIVWGTYLSYEIERIETKYTGGAQDWASGWSSSIITDTTGWSLVNIPLQRVGTRNWVSTQLSTQLAAADAKYPLRGYVGGSINSVRALDTRLVSPLPTTDLQNGVWFDFKQNSSIDLTGAGTYAATITMVPYHDNTGNINTAFRLAQSSNEMFFQNYTPSGTWGAWNKLIHTNNMGSLLWAKFATGTFTGVNAATPFSILNGNVAQNAYMGGLLISNQYADNVNIPTNGAYIKGSINTGSHGNSDNWNNSISKRVLSGRSISDANLATGTDFHFLAGLNRPSGVIDGALQTSSHTDAQWQTQMFSDWRTNQWYVRTNNNTVWAAWQKIWHSGNLDPTNFATNAQLSNYYTQNQSLALFVGLNGVQTIADTKTFSSSPIVPNATLNGHAVNLGQLANYAARDGANASDTWNNASKALIINPYIPGKTKNSSGDTYLQDATYGEVSGVLNSNGTSQGNPTDNWYHRIKMLHNNSAGYYTEIAIQMTGGSSMWYRKFEDGVFVGPNNGWKKVATTEELEDFIKTPSGASVIISGQDLNDVKKSGFYRGIDLINAPSNGWWFVSVEGHDDAWCKQTVTSYGSNNAVNITYQRVLKNWVWTAWKEITTGGGIVVDPLNGHMGYGGVDPTASHNHYFNGAIRITQGIYSESSNGDNVYAGNGGFYHLDQEIAQEDNFIRLAPFDKVFSGTNNTFATKNRVVKITLNDGGAIMMDEFFVNQEITIMNISGDYATFIVNNTSIKVKIDPRSSATFYVNSENRIVMVRMDNDYCRILG
jgi:hypothetical protein